MIEIDERLKIHEGEEELDYAMRLIEMKKTGEYDLDWSDITNILGLDCHYDSLRKSQDTKFGGYAVYQEMKKRNSQPLKVDYESEINSKIEELKKERVKLIDERAALNRKLRDEARFETLQDIMKQSAKDVSVKFPINYEKTRLSSENLEHKAILLLSDIHYGMETNVINNKYNIDVFEQRFETLLCKTLEFIEENDVSTLYVLGLGDLVNGVIHLTTRLENKENIVKQIIQFSENLSRFLITLSKMVKIEYFHVVGNHGRIFDKDSCQNDDNFELLIKDYVKARTEEFDVTINDTISSEIGIVNILGHDYVFSHGHREGLKDIASKIINIVHVQPTAIFLGHTHSPKMFYNDNVYVYVNGCMCGDGQYSENLRLTGKPSQSLFLANKDGIKYHYIVEL